MLAGAHFKPSTVVWHLALTPLLPPSAPALPCPALQHDNSRGPYKGGLRFHPQVDLDDVRR